eukprot:334217-Prorocentrum_minimum.AAC.1
MWMLRAIVWMYARRPQMSRRASPQNPPSDPEADPFSRDLYPSSSSSDPHSSDSPSDTNERRTWSNVVRGRTSYAVER